MSGEDKNGLVNVYTLGFVSFFTDVSSEMVLGFNSVNLGEPPLIICSDLPVQLRGFPPQYDAHQTDESH